MVSFLLPKRLHQDFYNVYAFCRWADDLGDEIGDTRREPAPARLVARRTWTRMYAGEADASGLRRAARTPASAHASPHRAVRRPDHAFEQDQTVTRYRDWDGCSATAATRPIRWAGWCCICAAIATRSGSGCPTPPAPRCNWPISGRMYRGSGEGPRLHSARGAANARLHRRGPLRAARHAGVPRGDAGTWSKTRASCSSKGCRWRAWWTAAWPRPRPVQPRRHARARQDRSAGLRRAAARPAISKAGARRAAAAQPGAPGGSAGPHEHARAVLPRTAARSRAAGPRTSTIRSCCSPRSSAMPCAPSTPSCATATT